MVVVTEAELAEMEENVEKMEYRPGYGYDRWYPTVSELHERITRSSKSDVLFLMWLRLPGMELNEVQKQCRKEIARMLYDPRILTVAEEKPAKEEE